jgi:integrase
MKVAVRYGAVSVNPVREVDSIEGKPKNQPRALTGDEVTHLRKRLASDEQAIRSDLPDLVTFLLGTGVRIGESLAVLWNQVDLEAGTVQITHTIARIRGEGLLRYSTKSKAGDRLLSLPHWAVSMLRARSAVGIRLDDPIFADAVSGFRDPSNTRRALRTALSPVGSTARRDLGLSLRALRRMSGMTRKQVADTLAWPQTRIELIETGRIKIDQQLVADLAKTYAVDLGDSPTLRAEVEAAAQSAESDKLAWIRSHALRKPPPPPSTKRATRPAKIADQLGQAKVSITQDVYLGRRAANPAAAEALDFDLWARNVLAAREIDDATSVVVRQCGVHRRWRPGATACRNSAFRTASGRSSRPRGSRSRHR